MQFFTDGKVGKRAQIGRVHYWLAGLGGSERHFEPSRGGAHLLRDAGNDSATENREQTDVLV